jgi:hemolysin-activating ACP:hemolysin acyltransferase
VPRTLTVSRASVDPAAEREYLEAVRELARLSDASGRRLWVFRSASRPGRFLECSESRSAEEHRVTPRLDPDEAQLERRIRALATYDDGAWELWEEVRF